MSILPEVSKKSEFWIPQHRYYELKHFCLQYRFWKTHLQLQESDTLQSASVIYSVNHKTGYVNTVEACAISRDILLRKVEMVERGIGLAVIQQRYDPETKSTYWTEIDPWLNDALYFNERFGEYFFANARESDNGIFPTVPIRKLMWTLRMKPLPKDIWETTFDRRFV